MYLSSSLSTDTSCKVRSELTISANINQVNSAAQRMLTNFEHLVKIVNFHEFVNGKPQIVNL